MALDTSNEAALRWGWVLIFLTGIGFLAYGIAFVVVPLIVGDIGLGVSHLEQAPKSGLGSEVEAYLFHLQVGLAAFVLASGIAIAGLACYGVRKRRRWALGLIVLLASVGFGISVPVHYVPGGFPYDHLVHLGPIYAAIVTLIVGVVLSYRALSRT